MIRGLYTAVSGMVASMRRMEVATNNLANTQTPGYKGDRTASATFGEQLQFEIAQQMGVAPRGPLVLANLPLGPRLDLTQGPLQPTGRALDVALQGPGFLEVQSASGTRYTRDGALTVDGQGRLVTTSGALVLGENGPLTLPEGDVLAIDSDGTIKVDDVPAGRLRVVDFPPDQQFDRAGNNELVARDGGTPSGPATGTTIAQGFIEQSNVDLTGTLSTTLELQRAYQANQRLVQQQDELTARAVNEIARPVS